MAYSRKKNQKKQKKNNMRSNKRRSSRHKMKNIKGGTCSCNQSLFSGGSSGPSNVGNLPIRYYYGMNDFNKDPNSMQIDTRMQGVSGPIMGGKSKRKLPKYKRHKKIKGGTVSMLTNLMSDFGTTPGINTFSQSSLGSTNVINNNSNCFYS
jgi:hypothetical protein